jgi:hypothetical protein
MSLLLGVAFHVARVSAVVRARTFRSGWREDGQAGPPVQHEVGEGRGVFEVQVDASAGSQCRVCGSRNTSHSRGPPSIGSVGDAYDNALMETINGLYKTECIRTTVFHDGPYKTTADVEYATAGWVDWYNARRLHGSLGNVPPIEYEQAHYAALNPEPQPA